MRRGTARGRGARRRASLPLVFATVLILGGCSAETAGPAALTCPTPDRVEALAALGADALAEASFAQDRAPDGVAALPESGAPLAVMCAYTSSTDPAVAVRIEIGESGGRENPGGTGDAVAEFPGEAWISIAGGDGTATATLTGVTDGAPLQATGTASVSGDPDAERDRLAAALTGVVTQLLAPGERPSALCPDATAVADVGMDVRTRARVLWAGQRQDGTSRLRAECRYGSTDAEGSYGVLSLFSYTDATDAERRMEEGAATFGGADLPAGIFDGPARFAHNGFADAEDGVLYGVDEARRVAFTFFWVLDTGALGPELLSERLTRLAHDTLARSDRW